MLAYDIFVAGILAGSVEIVAQSKSKTYRIETTARSHGFLDFLIEFRGQNEVHGRFLHGQAQPIEYKTKGIWAGEVRSVAIRYGVDGSVRYEARPSAAEDEREEVPQKQLPGTTDPFSALYQAILHRPKGATCDSRLAVFDGRRRFDILLEDLVGGAVAGPLYTGPARLCRARRKMIAGASRRTWLPQFARPTGIDIWLAPVQAGLPDLPVRMHADLGIADLVVDLVSIGGRKFPPGKTPPGTTPEKGSSAGGNHVDSQTQQ
ncbi:MAG: DUF3108 domain-containing protein [Rhodospirillaceae bacterium]|nr:DUF3108 domain-containing protein [Rhodospirillaceae bacterium]MBT4489065.1 DUF3108 domain-containing protein [Rhodospirillaceae bacterium]MBT6428817.1 DUF3108 domain-containing protein [Rhodospirillaceae bacterium]MBT7758962.1 DUF3108 domain-containing protein [Rhodospirillaceae bacterium]